MRPDLAALVGSRICHDLISPIGAISNGVELLSLTDGDTHAEMDLIKQSVENASARIRYFRIAYGAFASEQTVGRSEILSILSAYARGGRINYIWQIPGDQPRSMVRAAFLVLQAMETTMPLGGDIRICSDGKDWIMEGMGQRIKVDEALWSNLIAPDPAFKHAAAQVQFALLPEVLAAAGRRLHMTAQDARIEVRF